MPEASENQPHVSRACAFCRIIRREEEATVVFEDDLSLAFLDHRPLFPGHCLLVHKAHYETLADLPAWLVGPLFQNAQLLERAIEEGLGADGTFVALNNRVREPRQGNTSRTRISTSCHVTARMASKASSGPGNTTRMTRPCGRCRKRCARPAPGSDLVSSSVGVEQSARAVLFRCCFSWCSGGNGTIGLSVCARL